MRASYRESGDQSVDYRVQQKPPMYGKWMPADFASGKDRPWVQNIELIDKRGKLHVTVIPVYYYVHVAYASGESKMQLGASSPSPRLCSNC